MEYACLDVFIVRKQPRGSVRSHPACGQTQISTNRIIITNKYSEYYKHLDHLEDYYACERLPSNIGVLFEIFLKVWLPEGRDQIRRRRT
jgi:hypothetical protein